MKILGIHDGHNAAVCLLEDGKIVIAEQEERYTYEKNQGGMPVNTIKQILNNDPLDSIDKIAFVGSYMGQYDWSREEILASYARSGTVKDIFRQSIKQSKIAFALYKKFASQPRLKTIKQLLE